jgi:hypothetical protein
MSDAANANEHDAPGWMSAPAEAESAEDLIGRFWDLAGCPQLEKSEGEHCCDICLDELGWLALDLIPRLIVPLTDSGHSE